MYCNYQQNNWFDLLSLMEFAFNNAPSATTGISPFFANKGYHFNLTVHSERNLASARAYDFAVDLQKLQSELRKQIASAQKRYQEPADVRRTPPPEVRVEDEVFVKAKFFRTTRSSSKLSEKALESYKVIAQAKPQFYTLQLLQQFKAVHFVYHISILKPHRSSSISERTESSPSPVEIEEDFKFKISEVVDSKLDKRCRQCSLLYYVR